jgi:L-asparaginase / beta-aspartyl-peptidase
MSKLVSLAVHGGSGTVLRELLSAEDEAKYLTGLNDALAAGSQVLDAGGSAIDAVTAAVVVLEDCPMFNAGRGAVYAANGKQEMDASIMEGLTRNAGAVSMISGIKNPIKLARTIMEKSDFVFLAGEGAMEFAKAHNMTFEPESYFHNEFRYQQWLDIKDTNRTQLDHAHLKDEKFGTVGAVALDVHGNLAAATSTGGMTNKAFGRIGDSPMIGAGTYANNATCAVSCTGSGEYFIRGVAAYDVSCLMEYKGLTLQEACDTVVHDRLLALGGDGGLIAVDANGNVALPFNTDGMYRGYYKEGVKCAEIFKNKT